MMRRSERGLTLVELITVLGILTTIIGAGAIVFHDVMALHGQQAQYQQRRASAEHLLRKFAQDARMARSAIDISQSGPWAEFTMPDGERIEYGMPDGILKRVRFKESARVGYAEESLGDAAMKVTFSSDTVRGAVRSVVMTVEWDEPPSIGVSHPTLSLRVALRNVQ